MQTLKQFLCLIFNIVIFYLDLAAQTQELGWSWTDYQSNVLIENSVPQIQ